MARLESQAKAGAYPLDMWRAEQLASIIHNVRGAPDNKQGRILDPFANDGAVVKYLAEQWNMEAYGIELQEDLARVGQESLGVGNFIFSDAYKVEMSHGGFDVLYVNPPYDEDTSEPEARRAEYKGLRDMFKYLRNGGLVIWVAYEQHISKRVAKFFAEKCQAVFPMYWKEKHLDTYSQICLIGVKKDKPKDIGIPPKTQLKIQSMLSAVGSRNIDDHIDIRKSPFMEMAGGITVKHGHMVKRRKVKNKKTGEKRLILDYRIKVRGLGHGKLTFISKQPDIKLVKKINLDYGLQHLPGFGEQFRKAFIDEMSDNPVAEPRIGQFGLMIASGMLNNITLMHNDSLCMIRGNVKYVEKTAKTEVSKDANGNEQTDTTVHTVPIPTVNILYEDGEIENLSDSESLVGFIEEHMKELLEIFVKRYKPSFDMWIHELWGNVFDRNPIKGKFEYLPTQELVATAMFEHVMRKKAGVIIGEMGVGKFQPLYSTVYTPDGPVKMGDIKIGDKVVNVDGALSTVFGIFPQGIQPSYKVTFTDGSSTEAGIDHLWEVNTPLRKWKEKPPKVMTTGEIMEKGLAHSNGNLQHFIPMVAPVEFSEREHYVSPYIIGVLLGDGGVSDGSISITNPEYDIMHRVRNELPEGHVVNEYSDRGMDYGIAYPEVSNKNLMLDEIRRLSLAGKTAFDKFIPDEYKYDSVQNRSALLQGLLDTDGTIGAERESIGNRKGGKQSNPTYTTVSKQLAGDIVELVQSLGGTATVSERVTNYTYNGESREGALSYRLFIKLPPQIQPFYTQKKRERYTPADKYGPNRAIESIEFVGNVEQQCIAVDHPRHLYATDGFIMTHNTPMTAAIIEMMYTYAGIRNDTIGKETWLIDLLKKHSSKTGKKMLDEVTARYNEKRGDWIGLKRDDFTVVLVPAQLPEKWVREMSTTVNNSFVRAVVTAQDVHDFMDDFDDLLAKGENPRAIMVMSYESAKMGEAIIPAYQISYNKDAYESYWSEGKRKMKHSNHVTDPVTGGRLFARHGNGRGKYFTEDIINKSKKWHFFEGKVFSHNETTEVERKDRYGQPTDEVYIESKPQYFRAKSDKVIYPEDKLYPLPMFQHARKDGLPKVGNGIVEFESVEVEVKRKPQRVPVYFQPIGPSLPKEPVMEEVDGRMVHKFEDYHETLHRYAKYKQDKDGKTVFSHWREYTPKTFTVERFKIKRELPSTRNLHPEYNWIDDDPWLAMQGVYCTRTVNRNKKISDMLKEKNLTSYRHGGGHKDVDKELEKKGWTEFTTEGRTVYRNPKHPLADYIIRRYAHRFGLLVVDELHRSKTSDSDQGTATRRMQSAAKHFLGLTGTFYGGNASSMYAMVYQINDWVRRNYPWMRTTPMHFIKDFGGLENVYRSKSHDRYGANTANKRHHKVQNKEIPSASPDLLRIMMPIVVFAGLRDLGSAMPKFVEKPVEVEMSKLQLEMYASLRKVIEPYNQGMLANNDSSFNSQFYSTMLRWGDSSHLPKDVIHNRAKDPNSKRKSYEKYLVCQTPVITGMNNKEKMMLDLVKKHMANGERVIIFVSQTGDRDIRKNIADILTDEEVGVPDAKPFFISASDKASKREAKIEKEIEKGGNIMICNPRLVAEGIDLVQFSVTIYMEIESSLHVMMQSARRTWRISQEKDRVVVYYLYWKDIYQKRAVKSVADKGRAAATLYGDGEGAMAELAEKNKFYADMSSMAEKAGGISQEQMEDLFVDADYTDIDYARSSWFLPKEKMRKTYKFMSVVKRVEVKEISFGIDVEAEMDEVMDWVV